jgi:hypothetical protein
MQQQTAERGTITAYRQALEQSRKVIVVHRAAARKAMANGNEGIIGPPA